MTRFTYFFVAFLIVTTLAVASAATLPPTQGPGGPILIVSSSANPFTTYYAEILRAEGLNAFAVADISTVSGSTLAAYDVVILGEMALTSAQVTMFSDYVTSGGNLIAMRPDKQLAGLLGLTASASTLSNGYLLVDTSTGPGTGIVNQTIQFHGTADLYTLSGAWSLATLYSNSAVATTNPAVTWQNVGPSGGQAVAFTFDLARSIVYTRQGNPAWEKQERDAWTPIRSNDLFFGGASFDPKPDWVDLSKVQIPQADEQQRFLANLILLMNLDKKPLPRFWYFPSGKKAVVIMTGDDHSHGTAARFDSYKASSPSGCSVTNWECIRSSAYVWNTAATLTDAQAAAYIADGFDIGLHVNTCAGGFCATIDHTACTDWTSQAQLDTTFFTPQLSAFQAKFPSLPPVSTNRTHCITWSDYSSQPRVELNHGIRLDTNYYYYPNTWVEDQPGLFTGSGMPMRFAATDGTMIDVYQATTQMTDESNQSYPFTIDTLLDNAIGPNGYYGAFTANMHNDCGVTTGCNSTIGANAILASAQARGVSIISAKQMLTWLDGRNGSSFGSLAWNGNTLSFSIAAGVGANGIQAMLPTTSSAGSLASIALNGSPIAFTKQTIKGIEYAFFPATAGTYQVNYTLDTTSPDTIITASPPAVTNSTSASFSFSATKAESTFGCSLDGGSFVLCSSPKTYSSLANGSHTFMVRATDPAGHTDPTPASYAWSINTSLIGSLTDTTVADFGAGTPGSNTYISQTGDGEVILAPTLGTEFSGTALPAGWSSTLRATGGSASVGNGVVMVDGALIVPNTLYGAGRSLEFVATIGPSLYRDIGFSVDLTSAPWAIFDTSQGFGTLAARTNNGTTVTDTLIPGRWLNSPHRYRIDWNPSSVVFSIDGNVVATHSVSIAGTMRPLAVDSNAGGNALTVDWMRMSPYAASGTFLSRVLDANSSVNWGAASWTSSTPAGTSLGISVRLGNTPVPDGTWTAFTPIGSSGAAVSGTSRYLQYQATLTTTVPGQTPALNDITFGVNSSGGNIPAITSVSPASGSVGTSVTISGSNFGASQGTSKVTFNGTAATPTSWSATSIVAPVPVGASTGSVVVTVGGLASNGVTFSVTTPPALTNLSPTSGPAGTSVTINGSNFGASQGTSTVTFNGTAVTPTSWSATSIVASVPVGAGTGSVVVTVGGMASNGLTFTVTTGPPLIPKTNWTVKFVDSQETAFGTTYLAPSSFDGNVNTMWHTQFAGAAPPPPHEIQINLGNVYDMSGFRYLPRQDGVSNGRIGQYEFYVSSDGVNWGAAVATGSFANDATEKQVLFATKTGQYVRLRALTEINGLPYTSMAELNVLGSLSSAQAPALTNLLPTSGPAGTSVTINGSNFGASQGTSTVTFNGTAVTPTSWSATSIVASVPVGAGTGSVVVTVGGMASNGLTFTVTTGPPLIPKTNWTVKFVDSQETAFGTTYLAPSSFDGNVNTMWHTQFAGAAPPPPHEIQINLGNVYDMSGFRYLPRQDGVSNGRIGQYEFYVSSDGVNWGAAVATGSFANDATEKQVLFATKTGQYVRLRALTEINGLPYTSMAELSVLGSLSATLISKANWTLKFVDSQETVAGNYAATNSFDGNSTTMWHTQFRGSSPPLPHEIQINLGSVYNITGFRYLPRQDGVSFGSIGQYEFYVSSDGVNWGTAVATGSFANDATEKQVSFATKTGQYVRLRALTEINGLPYTSMAELNVLGF